MKQVANGNFFFGVVLWCMLCAPLTYVQKTDAVQLEAPKNSRQTPDTVEPNYRDVITGLEATLHLILQSQQELIENEQSIKEASTRTARQQLEQKNKALQETLANNNQNFVELATGGLSGHEDKLQYQQAPLDWKKELEEVVRPLISEVKEMTGTQREKEKIRVEAAFYKDKLQKLRLSLQRIQELQKNAAIGPEVSSKLNRLLIEIKSKIQEVKSQTSVLDVKARELNSNTGDTNWVKTLVQISTGVVFHLIVAFLAAFLIYYLIGRAIRLLDKVDTESRPQLLFAMRAAQFFIRLMSLVVAIAVYCAALVAFSEWALVSISMILILGILLSLKDVIPDSLFEMQTILNMGSLREGERLMYKGVPWRVNSLNFYTEIQNRDLNASLRLPISEVAGLRSRASIKSELWFPTRQGDYVLLKDGNYGQVIRQSPDAVLIEGFGALINYSVPNFLDANPQNLSRQKFTVLSAVCVSYKHQQDVTGIMLKQLNDFFNKAVQEIEFAEEVVSLHAEFDKADSSSLNYKVIMSCKGSGAQHYMQMRRWLNKTAVDCCNAYGWEIPFQQITVHQHLVLPA